MDPQVRAADVEEAVADEDLGSGQGDAGVVGRLRERDRRGAAARVEARDPRRVRQDERRPGAPERGGRGDPGRHRADHRPRRPVDEPHHPRSCRRRRGTSLRRTAPSRSRGRRRRGGRPTRRARRVPRRRARRRDRTPGLRRRWRRRAATRRSHSRRWGARGRVSRSRRSTGARRSGRRGRRACRSWRPGTARRCRRRPGSIEASAPVTPPTKDWPDCCAVHAITPVARFTAVTWPCAVRSEMSLEPVPEGHRGREARRRSGQPDGIDAARPRRGPERQDGRRVGRHPEQRRPGDDAGGEVDAGAGLVGPAVGRRDGGVEPPAVVPEAAVAVRVDERRVVVADAVVVGARRGVDEGRHGRRVLVGVDHLPGPRGVLHGVGREARHARAPRSGRSPRRRASPSRSRC